MNDKPFYSIIIPCYNTKKDNMKLLLESISKQNMNDDIEVIISNDRSTDTAFLDIVKEYKNLNIKVVEVPDDENLIHCPGNTREVGVSYATGEWITFVDHDDELIPNTFKDIKDIIIENGEQYIASADFYEINPYTNEILNEFINTGNWMHGKFYNLENFWKAKDFHFKKNLKTHEDIYISSKTRCELDKLQILHPLFIKKFCLLWKAWSDSISRTIYNSTNFLEVYFRDYIESTMDYYIDDYKYSIDILNDTSDENIYNHARLCIEVLMYMFFYVQGFKFHNPRGYILENELLINEYKRKVCEIFNIDPSFIYACITENNGSEWYNAVRKSSTIGVGNFVESETFLDFLNR